MPCLGGMHSRATPRLSRPNHPKLRAANSVLHGRVHRFYFKVLRSTNGCPSPLTIRRLSSGYFICCPLVLLVESHLLGVSGPASCTIKRTYHTVDDVCAEVFSVRGLYHKKILRELAPFDLARRLHAYRRYRLASHANQYSTNSYLSPRYHS